MTRRPIEALWAAAALARAQSRTLGVRIRDQEEAREAWWVRWAGLVLLSADDRFLSVCMGCDRYRDGADGWAALPARLGTQVRACLSIQVSHGYCPTCLAKYLLEFPG
jgi:hypothetical protein